MSQTQNPLASHIRHLRYAVATTTCRATVDALQKILNEADARFEQQNRTVSSPNTKLL